MARYLRLADVDVGKQSPVEFSFSKNGTVLDTIEFGKSRGDHDRARNMGLALSIADAKQTVVRALRSP